MSSLAIYILGLKSRYRGLRLEESLKLCGLEFENVWGPPVESLTAVQIQSAMSDFSFFTINRSLKKEEIACCIGHISMYRNFAESGKEWALFLEDDAILLSDPSNLLYGLQKADTPIHISIHDGPELKMANVYRYTKISDGYTARRKLDPPYGAYAYLLNRDAVLQILESESEKFISSPDWPYIWPPSIRYLRTKEFFFTHPEETQQSIIGERINAAQLWKNRIPSISRFREARKLGVPFRTAYNRELKLKTVRIIAQLVKRLSEDEFWKGR